MAYPSWEERMARSALLLSPEAMQRLRNAHVMLFGLGGVGSYAAEALGRAGIGRLTIVDADTVSVSNINRQLPALCSTVGCGKADVVRKRLLDINPDAQIQAIAAFHLPDSPVAIPDGVDFVADAIDTISAKIDLAVTCSQRGIPILSCMGMGNRLNPTCIRIGDLFETSGCPLCRVMRRELRKRGVERLACVYSTEPARACAGEPRASGHPSPGSLPFVPSVAGLLMAYEITRKLCEGLEEK
ncbi:MAG: tRNA threonylcarbamoyladenosine dehydratase [Eubacteriales bacterium]|nr:tRNA threonylcarbamoyladenosine dehydratase [Eubacteriales bacterium]